MSDISNELAGMYPEDDGLAPTCLECGGELEQFEIDCDRDLCFECYRDLQD